MKILSAILMAVVLCGCDEAIQSSDDGHKALAQAYFRLGVACGQNVNLRHQLAGEPTVTGDQLLKEAIAMDIDAAKANGEVSLLTPPPDRK